MINECRNIRIKAKEAYDDVKKAHDTISENLVKIREHRESMAEVGDIMLKVYIYF